MKKLLFLLLILFIIFPLYSADYTQFYEIMPSALTFDLSLTNRGPHTGGWTEGIRPNGVSGGSYYNGDMIGCVGVNNDNSQFVTYGVLLHVKIENNAQFRTDKDFSAYRNYGVEIVGRTGSGNSNHEGLTLEGFLDKECTIPMSKPTTTYYICDNTNPEIYVRMPIQGQKTGVWADLIMILDTSFQSDSLIADDNYYGEITVEMFQLNEDRKTINENLDPYSFTLYCTGYYNTDRPESYQIYNFLVNGNDNANYFSLQADSSWNSFINIGNMYFASHTMNQNSRSNFGKDYRIYLSPTSDYNNPTKEKFKFKRNGSVGESAINTVYYSVAVVPNPVTRGSEYEISFVDSDKFIQIADLGSNAYKSVYAGRTTNAIDGNEDKKNREIQVPFYKIAHIAKNGNDAYGFNYEGDIYIKLEGYNGQNNKDILQGGLYSSSIYVTVLSI